MANGSMARQMQRKSRTGTVGRQEHHLWCHTAGSSDEWCKSSTDVDECRQCVDLFGNYPFLPGETSDEATERYFPGGPAAAVERAEPEHELVLIKQGITIERAIEEEPKPPKAERWSPLPTVSRDVKVARIVEEVERIEITRTRKVKEFTRRTDYVVLETDGHRRGVQRVKTTISKLETAGKLPKDLTIYVQSFAALVAAGMGAATDDGHDSTNRMTVNYDGGSGGGFGSRTPSDRVLTGMAAYQEMRQRVPQEILPLFEQLVNEEVAGYSPLARTLKELGEALGYTDRLSTASGGTQVFFVAALIAHFLREKHVYVRSKDKIALEA